jgi:uncharacterized membrane protein YadS
LWAARQTQGGSRTGSPPIPWFVFGFLALVLLGDTGWIDPQLRRYANLATQILLTFALAAVGLETDIRRLIAQGWQPLLLGALATVYIALSTLLLALLWGRG